jgi:hypothetical protein
MSCLHNKKQLTHITEANQVQLSYIVVMSLHVTFMCEIRKWIEEFDNMAYTSASRKECSLFDINEYT